MWPCSSDCARARIGCTNSVVASLPSAASRVRCWASQCCVWSIRLLCKNQARRIHYSFHWPTLVCDYFEVTGCKGTGTGETLRHYPIRAGEYVLADRGYCKASGIHFAVSKGAYLTVRLSPQSIRLQEQDGSPFALLARLQSINKTGELGAWKVWIPLQGHYPLAARLCVLRKSEAAIALAQKK